MHGNRFRWCWCIATATSKRSQNYAIVGPTLYDLGTFVAHKIPLAELNLKATIQANDDRGVEFSVPAWVKTD